MAGDTSVPKITDPWPTKDVRRMRYGGLSKEMLIKS